MIISGIEKFTLLDFPDRLACVVFTGGCNFRCGFCHNPEFVLPEELAKIRGSFIPEEAVLNFLRDRQGKLQGVVISGGEPTLMPDLEAFIVRVRALGYAVKLDSNGNRPAVLRSLYGKGLLDYVAMDLKTDLPGYRALVGKGADEQALTESIRLIIGSGVEYEFRSTLIREIHSPPVLEAMRRALTGAKRLFLQPFRNEVTLHTRFRGYHPFSSDEMEGIAEFFRKTVPEVGIREA